MAIKFNPLLIASFLTCLFLVIISPTKSLQQGFTTELIHRDSPFSPFYNPSLNHYDRLRLAFERSVSRISRFKQSESLSSLSSKDVSSTVQSAKGEYVMAVYVGTPPVLELGIVDTGSDLNWFQCQPCLRCYKQNLPIFDSTKSTTYKVQSCDSQACHALDNGQRKCSLKNTCGYAYGYGDGSVTTGDIATETFSFSSKAGQDQSSLSFPEITFGCGHKNTGTFSPENSGLIGLGMGPLSLVSQFGSSIGGKFSYCLIRFMKQGNYTSQISFGSTGEVTGPGVISTPLAQGHTGTFYYLTLEGISVGNNKIPFYKKSSISKDNDYNEGNIIIDSGTTLTLLPSDMYEDLSSALQSSIKGRQVDDPSGILDLCYQSNNDGADLNIPPITAHFRGGDVVLKPTNTFISVADGVVCLAMIPADHTLGAIYGNIAQMDFLIGYDIEGGKVSFKPTDCTKGL